jgi:hypothetical protein
LLREIVTKEKNGILHVLVPSRASMIKDGDPRVFVLRHLTVSMTNKQHDDAT